MGRKPVRATPSAPGTERIMHYGIGANRKGRRNRLCVGPYRKARAWEPLV